MPFDSSLLSGFANNANLGDFIANAVESFITGSKATGGMGWQVDTPADGPGTGATIARIFSDGGNPPVWAPRTTAKTLWSFTGNGVNALQESYDQPGNPMNHPDAEPPTDKTTGNIAQLKCMGMTTVPGPFSDYWLFSDETASYFHMVLKVADRHYRHFHVGLLNPLHPDVDPDSFYITSHRWAGLDPDDLQDRNLNGLAEHKPYARHILPFANQPENNIGFGGVDVRSQGLLLYSPGYGSGGYDWWMMTGEENRDPQDAAQIPGRVQQISRPGSFTSAVPFTKTVGDVNATDDAVAFGWGFVSGYDDTLGTVLFECEPTFTTDGVALIPIYISLWTDFAGTERWGPMGQVPDVYRVNMKSLDPEQEITIGSDTYVVFPMINKDANATTAGEGYSGYEGLAYRKVTANAT